MHLRWLFASLVGTMLFFCAMLPAAAGGMAGAGIVAAKAVTLTEFTALNIRNRGPAKAAGVIYFIDGLDPAARLSDGFTPTYPYLHALNAGHGWDVISAKYPNSETDIANSVTRASAYVGQRVAALKASGYRKVVLAGQSWGGWVSVGVAGEASAASELDGLLVVAPAAYGSKVWQGRDNPYYLQNLTEYVRHIKSVRTPMIAVFFNGDDFDPGQRGDVTDAFLTRSGTPLLLIDRPARLAGHGAGWLPLFADLYAGCMAEFLESRHAGTCTAPALSALETGDGLTEAEARADKAIRPAEQGELAGARFILTTPDIGVRVLTFGARSVEVATADGTFDSPMVSRENEACLGGKCYRLYHVSDDRYLGFRSDGSFAGWLTPVR